MLVLQDVVAVAWSPIWSTLVFFAVLVVVLTIRPKACSAEPPREPSDALSPAPHRGRRPGRARRVLTAFPLAFSNPTTTTIALFVVIFMIASTAWNAFAGLLGYIALGHAVVLRLGRLRAGDRRREAARRRRLVRVRARPAGRRGRRRDRGAGRRDRASLAPAHLRRDHDRDLLHLPAAGLQPERSRAAHPGCRRRPRPGRRWATTSASTTSPPSSSSSRSPWPGAFAARGSVFSCSRFATTRIARAGSACARDG